VEYLILGLGLGLGAGLAPGPLLALVVTTTLSRGLAAGVRVACSPLVTDSVIIAVSVLVARAVPDRAAGALGVAGGLYVVWLGIEAVRDVPASIEPVPGDDSDPLRRGAVVNLLSPHPWLFWLTVGGPILVAAWARSPLSAVAFLVGFFALIVGTKVGFAVLVASGRRRLTTRGLRRAHVLAGALLLLAGLVLVAEFAGALLRG
jgi:threonine/homoserine/homoserine lactone efflux protein